MQWTSESPSQRTLRHPQRRHGADSNRMSGEPEGKLSGDFGFGGSRRLAAFLIVATALGPALCLRGPSLAPNEELEVSSEVSTPA